MSRISFTAAILLASAACSFGETKDARAVVDEIRKIARDEAASCERLLARAAPIARSAFDGKEWSTVSKSLADAGLEVVATDEGNSQFRCVVTSKACAIRDGVTLDLSLCFAVSGSRAKRNEAEVIEVDDASLCLSAALLADHEQIRREAWFAKQPLLHEAINDWPMSEAYGAYPILESIEVSIGDVGNPFIAKENGYKLELVLAQGTKGRQSRRRLNCAAVVSDKPGVARAAVGEWLSRDEPISGSTAGLIRELNAAIEAKPASYQLFLRDATHAVRRSISEKEWAAAVKELDGQGLKLLDESESDYGATRRYLIKEKAICTAGGQHMDLLLEVAAVRAKSNDAPTRLQLWQAQPLLRAEPDVPLERAAKEDRFGKETAVSRVLAHEEAVEAAKVCKIVKAVEISYGVIVNRWVTQHPWGFHVDLELGEPGDGESEDGERESRLLFAVDSELDPPQHGGAKLLIEGFVPRDTLGETQYWGGSISGPATDEEREPPTTSMFLTRKGAARWRKSTGDDVTPAIAYGLGDLKTLPAETTAIEVKYKDINDAELPLLARFAGLETLDLGNAAGITDAGLKQLAGLAKLRSVTLSGEMLNGSGFEHFVGMKNLVELSLHSSGRLNDDGIAQLTRLGGLKKLNLHWASALTDDQLKQIAKLAKLCELRIWGCELVTDAGLAHVATLGELEELSLGKAKFTSQGIAGLVRLKNLREITIGYLPTNEDLLGTLSQIASLEYVELHGLAGSDAGLESLAKLPQLQRIYLHRCTGISPQGVERFQGKLPFEFEEE